jgi:hypothetical protein
MSLQQSSDKVPSAVWSAAMSAMAMAISASIGHGAPDGCAAAHPCKANDKVKIKTNQRRMAAM